MDIKKMRKLMWPFLDTTYCFTSCYLANLSGKQPEDVCGVWVFDSIIAEHVRSDEGIYVLEQLVAMEQGWDVGEIEDDGGALVFERDDQDDPTSYQLMYGVSKPASKSAFIKTPNTVVIASLSELEEAVKGNAFRAVITTKKEKGWIEIYRHFLPDSYRDIPWCWKVCIKTINGRRLMTSGPESPRKIDAVRIAKKLAALTGLEVRRV